MSCLQIAEQPNKIITANQQFLTVCSEFQFSTFNLHPFSRVYHSIYITFSQGVSLECGKTVLAGRIEHGKGNSLYLWERGDILKECILKDNVIALTSSGREVLVLLRYSAIIVSETLEVVREVNTGDNLYGLGDISETLACIPDPSTGTLMILSLFKSNVLIIYAHNHPIRAMALSPNVRFIQGTLLATASTQGTLIRLFDTRSGNCIRQLRVSLRQLDISSLAISSDDKLVVAVCRDGNLYVFNLDDSSSLFSIYSYSQITQLPKSGKCIFTDIKTLSVITSSECLTLVISKDEITCISRHDISTLAEEWVLLD